MKEVKIKDNPLNLKIEINGLPNLKNMESELLLRLCSILEERAVKFVERRRSPKKGT